MEHCTVEDTFTEYCIKNNFDPGEIIISNNLQSFFFEKFNNNKAILAIGICRLKLQKNLNNNLFQELSFIDKKMRENNIKYIVLKGIPLGAELYSPPEVRPTSDIDVFIHPDKIPEALDVIGTMGYLDYTGQLASGGSLDQDPAFNYGNHHMMPFDRKYVDEFTGQERVFTLELHRSPFPRTKYDFGKIDYAMIDLAELINSSEEVIINGLPLFTLSVTNRLLHLLIHLSTHFFNDCRDFIFYNMNPHIQLRLVIDIARFLQIHQNEINWIELKEKACQWGFYEDVCFCAQVINIIFGPIVPLHMENKLSLLPYPSEDVDFMRRAIPFLIELDMKKLIFEDGYKELYNIIRKNTKHKNIYYCFHKTTNKSEAYHVPLIINEQKINDNTGKIDFSWDENGFYIQADMEYYSSILEANQNIIKTNDHIPGLFIFFYSTGNVMFKDRLCLGYCLYLEEDRIKLMDVHNPVSDIEKKSVPLNKYSCISQISGNILNIKAVLSWELLKTDANADASCGISFVYSNKMNMFEYCTPDRHNLLVYKNKD